VSQNFKTHGHLTPEEFFAIVIWKSNRSKTKVVKGIKKNKIEIHIITSEVSEVETREEKLSILHPAIPIPGIGIPIASAILAVCYPNEFTVVDVRALAALKVLGFKIDGDPTTNHSAYFKYLEKCKELAQENKVSLRNFDRILWAKNWYEGTKGLKHLVRGINTDTKQ